MEVSKLEHIPSHSPLAPLWKPGLHWHELIETPRVPSGVNVPLGHGVQDRDPSSRLYMSGGQATIGYRSR